MQKQHLHLILLLALVVGCKPLPWGADNPYPSNKNRIVISFDEETQGVLFHQEADLRLSGQAAPDFRLRVSPFLSGYMRTFWGGADGDPLELPRRAWFRSLTSLWLEDPSEKIAERAIPLPGGKGAAFTLEGSKKSRYRFSLSAPAADSVLQSPPVRVAKKTMVFRGPRGVLVVAASVRMDSVHAQPSVSDSSGCSFSLTAARRPQVVLLFDRNEKDARKMAERLARTSPAKLEALAMADLRSRIAFALKTEDDSTNRAFALLSSALVGASPRVAVETRAQIAEAATLTAALFLASREQPAVVFPEAAFTDEETRDNLRWGGPAYRAALDYGMAPDDSLHALAWRVVAGLSSVQREYASGDMELLSDWTNKDEFMRLAVAHVQLADLMTVGEEISLAQGEHEAQGAFRKEALRARRTARRLFTESARQYRGLPESKQEKLTEVLDSTDTEDFPESPLPVFSATFPDTNLFLLAGARYGFNWLDDRPALFWNPRLGVGAFVWQRWTAHRLRSDVALKRSADYDSLLSYLLNGGIPGMLTTRPRVPDEPSLPAMAAAFQNLAEVYLGVRPDAFRQRVDIEPRLPESWGHTTARVPFSDGFILLEYDFAREFAIVGAAGLSDPLEVFFGYPLETAGYLRTQFVLQPGDHPMRINLEHKAENRLDLNFFEVP